ncbi:unnamed protein product, partial [Protopolystoma xenopodis]
MGCVNLHVVLTPNGFGTTRIDRRLSVILTYESLHAFLFQVKVFTTILSLIFKYTSLKAMQRRKVAVVPPSVCHKMSPEPAQLQRDVTICMSSLSKPIQVEMSKRQSNWSGAREALERR